MRALSFAAFIVGILLIPTALGVAKFDRDRDISEVERALVAETDEHGGALESYFARARSIVLLTGNSPAFARVLAEPGTRKEKVARQSRNIGDVTHQLGYLEQLYPTSIGEACFIDANGEEFARAGARRDRQTRGPVDRRGAGRLLRTDLRAELRAGSPDPPLRLARHQGMGRRQRDPDPPGRRQEARVRALRGHRGELPPRDGRSRARTTSCGSSTAAPARSSSTAAARSESAPRSEPPATRVSRSSPAQPAPAASPRSTDTRPPTATSSRLRATPTTGSSSPAPRRPPAASSQGSGRSRSRCSRSHC